MLGMKPSEFWSLTPAETNDLYVAHKRRENRIAMRKAWELSLMLQPHIKQGYEDSVSQTSLFKKMPGAFPGDIDWDEAPKPAEDIPPEHEAERQRRLRLPRLQRPDRT